MLNCTIHHPVRHRALRLAITLLLALAALPGMAQTAPTDITLTPASVTEGLPVGTIVGSLAATDAEGGAMTYSLVAGSGDTDNAWFTITNGQLVTATVLEYERKPACSVRIRVTDASGLSFEKAVSIQIVNVLELTDIDGTKYNTVVIGDQEWMAENLKVTKYSNGDLIPTITDPTQWVAQKTGARCLYNND
ncbi:MAG: cadherin domain-containing protein, partial [Bacteroidota bacterium]